MCGNCVKRRLSLHQCQYKIDNARSASTNEYIDLLHKRIQELERGRRPGSTTVIQNGIEFGETPQGGYELCGVINISEGNILDVPLASLPTVEDGPGSSFAIVNDNHMSPVDAMGADSVPDGDDPNEDKFYGSSSAVFFMDEVRRALSLRSNILNDQPQESNTSSKGQNTSSESLYFQQAELFMLLPRRFTDHLLQCYFKSIHPIYPFVHKPTFEQAYRRLWTSNESGPDYPNPGVGLGGSKLADYNSLVFNCALNIILALAVQYSDTPAHEKPALSEYFLKRSTNLLRLDFWNDGSIAVVQTLLIMTLYLQSSVYPNRCWSCIGTACRLAQGVGLHVADVANVRNFSPLEIEVRRRVWHGCVDLDLVVSMTLGRPPMLYNDQVRVPLPLGLQFEPESGTSDVESPSRMSYFVEASKLSQIFGKVLVTVYNPWRDQISEVSEEVGHRSKMDPESLSWRHILELDKSISVFESLVPSHLQWVNRRISMSTTHSRIFDQQVHTLHTRTAHLRLLLHRPTLVKLCRRKAEDERNDGNTAGGRTLEAEMSSSFALNSSIICLKAALELVDAIYEDHQTEARNIWWYTIHYVRNSAMVALIARTCEALVKAIGAERLSEAWQKCQSILTSMMEISPIVKDCLNTLQKFHDLSGKNDAISPMDTSNLQLESHDCNKLGDKHIQENMFSLNYPLSLFTNDNNLEGNGTLSQFDTCIADLMDGSYAFNPNSDDNFGAPWL
jgi:hypothetical protein